jgi:hypothetical protein
MTNIEMYNDCKHKLSEYLKYDEKKLIIISGSGGNGKTTLINELKSDIRSNKYSVLTDISKDRLYTLQNNFKFDDFKHLILDIIGNLDDFNPEPSNSNFFHIDMNSIQF